MQIDFVCAACGGGRGRGEVFAGERTHEDLYDLSQRCGIQAHLQVLLVGALPGMAIRVVR